MAATVITEITLVDEERGKEWECRNVGPFDGVWSVML